MSVNVSTSSSITLIPFDGKDYSLWKIKSESYICSRGWKDVCTTTVISTDDNKEKVSERKIQAYTFLVNSLNNTTLSLFRAYATGDPYVLWTAMVKHYERDTSASKHATRAMMMGQRLGEGEDVSVYVSRLIGYSQQLVSMGETVSDGELLFCLLNGLPHEYASLKRGLQLKDNMTFATAIQHIKDDYEATSVNNASNDHGSYNYSSGHAMYGKLNGNRRDDKPYCTIHKFHGHDTKDCTKNKDRGANLPKHNNNNNNNNKFNASNSKPYCYLHKSFGHATKDCFILTAVCGVCGEVGHIKNMCRKDAKEEDDDGEGVGNAAHNNYEYSA